MNRAEIAEKYKAVIERRLSKFRNDEAQEFYTKILPNRLEEFRANYTGSPEELEAAMDEEEEERVLDFWDYLDDKTAEERERAIAEYAENDADYQPLASEIIADLQKENENLKVELQDKQENLDLCAELADRYMYRQRIIECTLKLDNKEMLKCAYAYMKRLSE